MCYLLSGSYSKRFYIPAHFFNNVDKMYNMNQKEVWKDVKNYEGHYQVSNLGRVKSLKLGAEKIIKQSLSSKRYASIGLCLKGKQNTRRIHQLVAEAFLNHTPCGYKLVVNHINSDRFDNRVENLEVISQRENTNQKHRKSSSKYIGVNWNKHAKKWMPRIRINGKLEYLGYFINEYDAHLAYEEALENHLNKIL